jgi:hypothetical protein
MTKVILVSTAALYIEHKLFEKNATEKLSTFA